MIPYMPEFIAAHHRGEMPASELVALAVKYIALSDDVADYAELPAWLKSDIAERLEKFKKEGRWQMLSIHGFEDYGIYADAFLRKMKGEAGRGE